MNTKAVKYNQRQIFHLKKEKLMFLKHIKNKLDQIAYKIKLTEVSNMLL